MTTRIINYFKTFAKYDKQQKIYYINNLKTVFEHYNIYNEDNELMNDYYNNNEIDNDINNDIKEFKKYDYGTFKYIDLEQKQILNDETINKILQIFNFLMINRFNCNNHYKLKFEKYILYILEKERTNKTHEENKFKEYRKYKEWFYYYDMNYEICSQINSQKIENIEKRINEIVDDKIKDNLSNIFNNNPNLLKDLIYNLNEQSKQILINEIIKYNESEVIERISKKISQNEQYNKFADDVIKESESIVKQKFNNYLKSNSIHDLVESTIKDYLAYNNCVTKECKIYVDNINSRLSKVNNTIKNLELKYINLSSNSNSTSENDNSTSENDNNNYEECFISHGNKYSLKLKELMKHSKYKSLKDFKLQLINNDVIKKDFTLNGSTYRLTEEQKKQFIKDFNKFK